MRDDVRGDVRGDHQQADREALGRLKRGDPSGFDLAYDRHRDRVYAFLVRLSGRADLADDLFQETWLRFSRKAASLCDGSDLRSWLFTVARHLFVSQLRHDRARRGDCTAGRRPATVEVDDLRRPGSVASASSAEHGLALSELERALLTLSVEDRELLLLVSVEGLGQDEAAVVLGIAAPALRKRVTRARARLAAILDAESARLSEP
jgi:RNA polymerase sigma-70 factor (ECF subfamily)